MDRPKAECCENGLHVAAGITDSTIWIAARDIELNHVFSIDILTKQIITYEMTERNVARGSSQNINLCCKCVMPIVRFQGTQNVDYFLITPRRFKKDTEICQYDLIKFEPRSYYITKRNNIFFDHDPSSSVAFSNDDETLSVNKRSNEDGRIKTFILKSSQNHRILNIPDAGIDNVWHDMTFLSADHGNIFALTQRQNADNITMRFFIVGFTNNDTITFSGAEESMTVDLDFPSFESSPFLFSYSIANDPSCQPDKFLIEPKFIVFQSSVGIVTVPLRMLSLSESAYLTLRTIHEPLLPVAEVNGSPSKKKVEEKWMSLNFIKKTMGLPNDFDLK